MVNLNLKSLLHCFSLIFSDANNNICLLIGRIFCYREWGVIRLRPGSGGVGLALEDKCGQFQVPANGRQPDG
jgi:hypothetical protein